MPRKDNSQATEKVVEVMFHSLVEEFCQVLRVEQKLALSTITSYCCAVRRFAASLPPDKSVLAVDAATVQRYLNEYGVHHAPGSVKAEACALRALSRFIMGRGYWQLDPTASLALPRGRTAKRLTLTDEQVQKLLAAANGFASVARRAQARAVLSVLAYSGLRKSEMMALKVGDVDLKANRLDIWHGKGNKARSVFIPRECTEALRVWIGLRPTNTLHDKLFCYNFRYPLGRDSLKTMLREVAAMAGYEGLPNVKCHAFRHNYATRLLRNGGDIASIQAALGHSNMTTTFLYLSTDTERLKEVAEKSAFRPPEVTPTSLPASPPARSAPRWKVERTRP